MSILTFNEACSFVTEIALSEKLYESETSCIFVEIDPTAGIDDIDRFCSFVNHNNSVNLVIVGILNCSDEELPSNFLKSFDILLTDSRLSRLPAFVEDISIAIQELDEMISLHTQPALVLAHLLRQKAYQNVSRGLVLESLSYGMLQSGSQFKAWLNQRGDIARVLDEKPVVLASRSDESLEIYLNRPERSNAYSSDMRDQLFDFLQIARFDEAVTKVKLHGLGKSFCSGGELAEFGSVDFPPDGHIIRMHRSPALSSHSIADKLEVYLHGVCAGAGIEIPAFASRVFGNESVEIFLPEISMGLIPGAGGTVSLPRRIGPQKTAYLAMSGKTLSLSDALAWGLIDEAVEYEPNY
ncbi:MAG: enoyl-CoA hydratase/isomerase family protein [Acidimicrobiales bacterium]